MRSASRIVGIIAAAAASGLAACSTAGPGARPAAAGAAATAVRVQPDAVGWSGMAERPERIYVGMGGAPIVRQLTWRDWGRPQAWARGTIEIYRPQPGPISSWHPATYPVRVRLAGIATHDGQPSYRKMADFYVSRHGVAKTLYFSFAVLPGGSVPGWNPEHRPGRSAPVPAEVTGAGRLRARAARPA